ncbi:hypothetical protein [Nocardioides sp. LHG3406-4]|uniref:hypothetical protein n=1 Tax=Nocardioides sp. LHG3406-4 TaxID=2804575 RepID=UPI003CEE7C91
MTVNPGGCGDLDRGDATYRGGDDVVAAFSHALWKQRSIQTPPAVNLRARCAPNRTLDTPLVLEHDINFIDAVLCEYTATVRQARLGADEVAAFNAEFEASEDYEQQPGCPSRMLRGITAWGDRFSWYDNCWNFYVPSPYPPQLHWERARICATRSAPCTSVRPGPGLDSPSRPRTGTEVGRDQDPNPVGRRHKPRPALPMSASSLLSGAPCGYW